MKTILVVDDHPDLREVVCYALTQAGFETLEASDGERALELFWEQDPDLVVTNINMPRLDGFDVCREIRRKSATPIMFLTARSDEEDRIRGMALGADDYMTKPFEPQELVVRVKNVLASKYEFWNLVAHDIENGVEAGYRIDERWTTVISESNSDKEQAKDRYLEIKSQMYAEDCLIERVLRVAFVLFGIVFLLHFFKVPFLSP